jgi:hypothetical protein
MGYQLGEGSPHIIRHSTCLHGLDGCLFGAVEDTSEQCQTDIHQKMRTATSAGASSNFTKSSSNLTKVSEHPAISREVQ